MSYSATTQIRVRYGETDKMGYLYYGNYFLYYEVGRTEALRALGVAYTQLEADGIILPVAKTEAKYIRPARYDDLITVKTTIPEMPGARLRFDYELYNQQKELLNTGYTAHAFVHQKQNKPCRPPKYFLDKIKSYFSLSEKR